MQRVGHWGICRTSTGRLSILNTSHQYKYPKLLSNLLPAAISQRSDCKSLRYWGLKPAFFCDVFTNTHNTWLAREMTLDFQYQHPVDVIYACVQNVLLYHFALFKTNSEISSLRFCYFCYLQLIKFIRITRFSDTILALIWHFIIRTGSAAILTSNRRKQTLVEVY